MKKGKLVDVCIICMCIGGGVLGIDRTSFFELCSLRRMIFLGNQPVFIKEPSLQLSSIVSAMNGMVLIPYESITWCFHPA